MFLAPALYPLHAVLTGVCMVVMDLLGVKLGFGFSAGLFDYVLGYGISSVRSADPSRSRYFASRLFSFRWCIRIRPEDPGARRRRGDRAAHAPPACGRRLRAGARWRSNLATVEACMTRLRLTLNDPAAIDETQLRALGAKGIVRPGGNAVQVVLGPIADRSPAKSARACTAAPEIAGELVDCARRSRQCRRSAAAFDPAIVRLADAAKLDEAALKRLGARAIMRSGGGRVHLFSTSRRRRAPPPLISGLAAATPTIRLVRRPS